MVIIEKNTDVRIKCYRCGNEYLMGMMRMDSSGKSLVCRNCLERKPVQKDSKTAETKAQNPSKQEESPMKEYFCKECKYNFQKGEAFNCKHMPVLRLQQLKCEGEHYQDYGRCF